MSTGILQNRRGRRGSRSLGVLGVDDGIADRVTDVAPIDPTTGMAAYPWMAYSPRTKSLQAELAAFLGDHGYAKNGVDGKLGATTCGYLRFAHDTLKFGWAPPDTCQSFGLAPKCVDTAKCGPAPLPTTANKPPGSTYIPPVVQPVPPVLQPPKTQQMSMATKGGLLAAVLVIGYTIAKKKGLVG